MFNPLCFKKISNQKIIQRAGEKHQSKQMQTAFMEVQVQIFHLISPWSEKAKQCFWVTGAVCKVNISRLETTYRTITMQTF